MLKWTISTIVNRIFILALILLAMNSYLRTSCGTGMSLMEQVHQAAEALKRVSEVLSRP